MDLNIVMKEFTKRERCFKALKCLYIAVDASIADDVNDAVKEYIKELEKEIKINTVGSEKKMKGIKLWVHGFVTR